MSLFPAYDDSFSYSVSFLFPLWGSLEDLLLTQHRLATVNFFLGLVGIAQVSRIVAYNMSVKNQSPKEQLVEAKEGAKEVAKGIEKDVVNAVKSS